CHTLFGEGAAIGPDLTGAERSNLDNMLLSIVDPSVALREGFTLFHVQTKDGRDLVGFITERDGSRLTLRDTAAQLTSISISDIVREEALTASMMPEGLLDDLNEEQVRDFFAYFMSQPPKSAK
ncbi:MAG: dehydrogenase, partial [Verrucomicrobiota bacterium]